jgi:hypothetical protein
MTADLVQYPFSLRRRVIAHELIRQVRIPTMWMVDSSAM